MADRKNYEALYQSLARDLLKLKGELVREIGYTTAQVGALYESMKDEGGLAIAQELRYTYKQNENIYAGLTDELGKGFQSLEEKLAALERIQTIAEDLGELKYAYQQLQAAYENLDVHSRRLLDAVEKIKPVEIDYDRIVDRTVEQVVQSMPYPEKVDYNRIGGEIAKAVASALNMDVLAEKVAKKLDAREQSYDVVLDEDGVEAVAQKVAEKLCGMCGTCEYAVEEIPEEAPAEEPVAEEAIAEEPPVQEEAQDELAVAVAPAIDGFEGDQLVDAETGLVVRLKKSFTAKMKQSEEKVKGYYSEIKNELTSYKKINSNISWHGDRFNFGRETVAKMNICGKTLGLYLALDPNDPEFKSTVYHQKDVSGQKAYESTPFMVKVKSDAAVKKALRLVAALAKKYNTEKENGFKAVDYVSEFGYETTKKLFEDGFIKATKEKKVELDF